MHCSLGLTKVILDKDLRINLANEGRHYVETHQDHLVIAKNILKWLEPDGIVSYDYNPDFAKEHYKIPQQLIKEEKRLLRKPFVQKYIRFLSTLNKQSKDY